ncbi:MAG: carboxypeptidase regulatory-like domain-containing protein [Anaerolineae bacterium]
MYEKNSFEPVNNNINVTSGCGNIFPFSEQVEVSAALIAQATANEGSVFTALVTPTNTIDLVINGPTAVATGDTFNVTVVAQHVPAPGLYGAQFEINFNPTLLSLSNLQPNSDLSFVVLNEVDNTLGKLKFVASRQGDVPGLTGDVALLTFDVTAGTTPCMPTLSFANVKIGDPQANAFTVIPHNYTVSVGIFPTPTPITPTSTPETPTSTPETPTSTPETPTSTPETPTSTPETPTSTPETPTSTPETPTSTPETPTSTPETPTSTPETPTATPETPTPTPETPTPTPTTATVSGQVILTGQANNNWAGAVVQLENGAVFSATTDASGNFSLTNVPAGTYTSVSADAPGYLPAVCNAPVVTAPLTTLANVTLLSGDINDDGVVNIVDGTTVGTSFGETGSDLPADLNRDGEVDIFDIILVSINFGQTGPQTWVCQ